MSSAIENLARLNNEISELVSELYAEFADFETGTSWDYTRTLSNYIRRVTKIGLSAGRANLTPLQEACLVFQDSLRQLRDSNPVLSADIRNTLEEWPLVALTVFETPADSGALTRLQHLSALCSFAEIPEASGSRDEVVAPDPALQTAEPTAPDTDTALSLLQARIIDVMSVLLHELDMQDYRPEDIENQLPEILENAAHDLQDIGIQLATTGFVGLMDVCHVMTELLLQKAAYPGSMDEATVAAIEQWPGLILAYLQDPACEAHAHALLDNLNSAPWQHSLSDNEYAQLRLMLVADDHVITPPGADSGHEENLAGVQPAVATDMPEHASTEQPVLEPSVTEQTATEESVTEQPVTEQPVTEQAEPAPPQRAEPVPEATKPSSPVMTEREAASANAGTASPSDSDAVAVAGPAAGPETLQLNDAARELIGLLKAEVQSWQEAWDQQIIDLATASAEQSPAPEAAAELIKLLDRFIPAVDTMGLQGLAIIFSHSRLHLAGAAEDQAILAPALLDFLALLPLAGLEYLDSLESGDANTDLAELFEQVEWPHACSGEPAQRVALLARPALAIEDSTPQRATEATAEDVSLALPGDVNQTLLDTLLQELPGRSAEFTETISRLAGEAPGLTDVEQAQRIAHTLKGSANTVGITGIATLTHHIEDVLGAFVKHERLPDARLVDLLINAADVLETMSEALLHIGPPPDNARQILQAILDCANIIDREGLDGYYAQIDKLPRQPAPAATADSPAAPASEGSTPPAVPEENQARPRLRVDPELIDELLKIIGESVIIGGQLDERLAKLLQHSATIARQNELFQLLCHELEQMIDVRGYTSLLQNNSQDGTFDSLEMEQYNELHTITHRLVEAATDSTEFARSLEDELNQMAELLVNQARMHKRNQEVVMQTRMLPVETIVPRLQRVVRQTCRFTDKQAALKVSGATTLIDSDVLDRLIDPLMHIIRNAIDHGIEAPAIRLDKGKPAQGRILLDISRQGDTIRLVCEDDGAGLDFERLRNKARQLQLLDGTPESEEELLSKLVFQAGFTTRESASQISGRGIGLDAVQNTINALKGTLRLDSRPDAGCRIEMRLPLSLITLHALLVESSGQTLAVSSHGVEQIVPASDGEYAMTDHGLEYRHGDNIYPAHDLQSLLQRPGSDQLDYRTTLLVRDASDGKLRAIALDQVTATRDLVVKQLGQYVPELPGIEGATILGDGSISPVIDLPELLRHSGSQHTPMFSDSEQSVETVVDKPLALVIDDSLSARRALEQFVSDLGFEAVPARDGLEGVEVLARTRPDIILVDMEMPRMNGLEFVSHLRAEQRGRKIPVIMITSRATEKHRSQAEAAGVDVYLTKPYQEDLLHEHIQQLMFEQTDPVKSSIA